MKILICGADYISFLTAVYNSFYKHKDTESITTNRDLPMLLDEAVYIDGDISIAKRVNGGLLNKYGEEIHQFIYETYLADYPDKENIIFKYIKLLIKFGRNAAKMYQNEDVMNFYTLHQKVNNDARRMIQFIRLQEMDNGVYYGPFVSDHDVIELIITHFKERFNTLKFVLHDLKRGKMIYFDGKRCHYSLAPENLIVNFSDEEKALRPIWKNYVKNIAIEARTNKKVQAGFMPHRYRVFMHEFLDD